MSVISFALRNLLRDLRAGELTVLMAAMIVAVTSMTAVGFFTDRVGRAVGAQAAETLAADVVIRSPDPISAEYLDAGSAAGLETATAAEFPTVAIADGGRTLSIVSAVTEGYPLRGKVLISDRAFGDTYAATTIPEPGTAWAEASLMARIDVEVGDTIKLGRAELRLTKVLDFRPDQGFGFISLAPSVIVHADDVPAMDVIKPGSRVTYKQLFAGDPVTVAAFAEEYKDRMSGEERLSTIEDASEQITAAISRARRFLTLASLVTVILAAVATAMAARRYASRHLDTVREAGHEGPF